MQEAHAEAFTSAFKANKRAGDANGTYDHVYIDVNNVLHVAAHHTKNEDAFFKKLFALLDLNMRRTRPQYTVVLALDGPAPIAKTITQRRRRIRLSSGEKVPLSEDPPRLLKIGLTPGSALALKIDRALEYYAATRLLSRNALPKGLLFEISGTRVPGEGEVKILRSMKTRVRNPKFRGHSHLIVSEDSDALLLAITAAPADVFVLSSKLVFSVRAFNASLEKDLPEGMSDAQMRGARRDFVALAVMMGNDYLPGSRFGVKYSWRAYARLRGAADAPDWKAEAEAFPKKKAFAGRNRNRNDSGAFGGDAEADVRTVDYASDVRWGKYKDTALFPVPSESDFGGPPGARGGTRRNFFGGVSSAAVYEEGKLAFRHPPPVNWPMLRDFATVLSDPEYVKWQVSGGLRPRADVQRAVNAAAASADAGPDAFQASLSPGNFHQNLRENSVDGREQRERDEDLAPDESREGSFSTIPGVAGVVRAMLDPKRSARRAYEYVHGVGWVLEMYYGGACLDYGYHFQYSSKEHNAGIAATIGEDGAGGEHENGARKLARAADDAATAAATAAVTAAAAAAAAAADSKPADPSATGDHPKAKPPHMGGRNTTPPPAVDLADFQTLPDTYDPSLDPLRDRNRASIAYLNRYPITPLAYSLAVIPRGGRAMLARGVRPLVDAGSPVHHLFCDDYCVTCIKHRITAGPLERVIQQESAGNGGGGGRGRGGGRAGGRGRGRRGRGRGDARGAEMARARDLSRKFAGGDATIREAAAAGGDVAREVLKKLNRRHLEHLSRAPQHAQDKTPPPLNDLEGAVARVSLDDGLNEDEETLRTLGDQPVLIWHHKSRDPPEVDLTLNDALTDEEDIPRWAARVTPAGCRPVGGQMHEIRRYDGDAEPVIAAWAVGGEAPPVPGGPGGGGKPKASRAPRRIKPRRAAQASGGSAGRPGDAKAKRGRGGGGGGGKESGDGKESGAGTESKSKPAARVARPRTRPARVEGLQTREPSVSPPSPTATTDDTSGSGSQPLGGGRASAFPSVAGGGPARRSRFAAGLGFASRRWRREKSGGLRAATSSAAARGAAFAFV